MVTYLGLGLRLGLIPYAGSAHPGWWRNTDNLLDGEYPQSFLDFSAEKYAAGNHEKMIEEVLNFTSSSALRTYKGADGVYRTAGTDVPRVDYSSGMGQLLLTGFFIQKCRGNTIAPNTSNWTLSGAAGATLTVVSDAAQLTAAGLSTLVPAGNVYKLDNSAGATTATAAAAGTCDNGNTHVSSAYARVFSGTSGAVEVSSSGSTTFVNTTYQRVDCIATPVNTTRTFAITAAAGAVVYFILPNFIEAPQAMPIAPDTNTVSATFVPGDTCQLSSAVIAALQGAGGAIAWRGTTTLAYTSQQLVGLTGGALIRAGSSNAAQVVADGSTVFSALTATTTPNPGTFGACMGFGPSGRNISVNSDVAVSSSVQADRDRSTMALGPVTGIPAGQILRISQIAIWSFADRPSDAGIQGQSISYIDQSSAPPAGYEWLRGMLADGSYVTLRGLNALQNYVKLSGKVS